MHVEIRVKVQIRVNLISIFFSGKKCLTMEGANFKSIFLHEKVLIVPRCAVLNRSSFLLINFIHPVEKYVNDVFSSIQSNFSTNVK